MRGLAGRERGGIPIDLVLLTVGIAFAVAARRADAVAGGRRKVGHDESWTSGREGE
jgi:hypothetical protein